MATLRCGYCFELSFPGDLHCRGCGQELGLHPVPEQSGLGCPDCKVPLHAYQASAGELLACEACGGQMVPHTLLRALVEQREALGRAVPSPMATPRGNPLSDPVRYRPCPSCAQLMNRKNFGGTSGVVVDVCSLHGTFFDAGELPRVLDFVRRGGLAKANAALAAQASSSQRAPSTRFPPARESVGPTLLEDLAGIVGFLVDVLARK